MGDALDEGYCPAFPVDDPHPDRVARTFAASPRQRPVSADSGQIWSQKRIAPAVLRDDPPMIGVGDVLVAGEERLLCGFNNQVHMFRAIGGILTDIQTIEQGEGN